MRWIRVVALCAIALPLLAACEEKKEDQTATQKATPDNTAEVTCRMIKECEDELKRRQNDITDKFWERTAPEEMPPPEIDTNAHSGESSEQDQTNKPAN
jgi:hypothetical protein